MTHLMVRVEAADFEAWLVEWFRSDTFKEATQRATVTRRELYVTEPAAPARRLA